MRLQVKTRHGNVNDQVKGYAEKKLSKLDRRLHDLTLVELTFDRERNPKIVDDHVVEAVVHMKGPNIVVRAAAPTYEAAVDRLVDTLGRQVERKREKRTQEPRRTGGKVVPPVEALELGETESAA